MVLPRKPKCCLRTYIVLRVPPERHHGRPSGVLPTPPLVFPIHSGPVDHTGTFFWRFLDGQKSISSSRRWDPHQVKEFDLYKAIPVIYFPLVLAVLPENFLGVLAPFTTHEAGVCGYIHRAINTIRVRTAIVFFEWSRLVAVACLQKTSRSARGIEPGTQGVYVATRNHYANRPQQPTAAFRCCFASRCGCLFVGVSSGL